MEQETNQEAVEEHVIKKITNSSMLEYDIYDIIDFLEPEYINDWLNLIPNDLWIKNKKTIENQVCKLHEPKIISYVVDKINLNLPKFITLNFEKINLNLLKYCVETNLEKLKKEIKNKSYLYKEIISKCIFKHDYEFNKYFYEIIYFELEPEHKIEQKSANITNLFGLLKYNNVSFHPNNIFYEILIKNISRWNVPYFLVFKYYNEKFKNSIQKYTLDRNYNMIFLDIFNKSKLNNFEDLIELKNILNITDTYFNNQILCLKLSIDKSILLDVSDKSIMFNICKTGDINLILKILNFLDEDIIQKKENILRFMVCVSLTNKIENVFLIYNILLYEKNCIFTEDLYSKIIFEIIQQREKKFHEYDKIIFELINLGGKIKGCSLYTDYIEKLKIKKIS